MAIDFGSFVFVVVFQLILILMVFINKSEWLALLPLLGAILGIYMVVTLGPDGSFASGYFNGVAIPTSDSPAIDVPIFLSLMGFVLAALKGIGKL